MTMTTTTRGRRASCRTSSRAGTPVRARSCPSAWARGSRRSSPSDMLSTWCAAASPKPSPVASPKCVEGISPAQ
eukprot:1726571-Prymnesium_polylepis.1